MLSSPRSFQPDADLLLGRKVSTRRASDVLDHLPLVASPARISVSPSLLAATMIQKSSLRENPALSQRR
jgi:hypothetical protein